MSPVKEMFTLFLLLPFAFGLVQVIRSTEPNDSLQGSCSCGGFAASQPAANSEPLLAQTPGLVVKCNDDGAETCESLCLALATTAKAKGPEILCVRLKDANELKLSAFYKICDRPWFYANMTAEEPLCCENSMVKVCPSVERTMAINIDEKEV